MPELNFTPHCSCGAESCPCCNEEEETPCKKADFAPAPEPKERKGPEVTFSSSLLG